MSSNILKAIIKLSTQRLQSLPNTESTSNRAQDMGSKLEKYIKNAFLDDKVEESKIFSHCGAKNSPPDLILKGGDAIEIKKLEGATDIQLNSSFPKQHVKHSDRKLTSAARNCEAHPWKKDLIYAVGHVPKGTFKVQSLWFVYGDCYADKESVYLSLFSRIQTSISDTEGVDFSPTAELGRVNRCDSQSNANLRIRSMWLLKHPTKVFTALPPISSSGVYVIMRNEKYNSFPEKDRLLLEQQQHISITHDFVIPNPESEECHISATFISFVQ